VRGLFWKTEFWSQTFPNRPYTSTGREPLVLWVWSDKVMVMACQDPTLTTPWGLDRQCRLPCERALLLALPAYSHFPVSSHFRRTHAPLVVTLPAYSRAARTHTSGVLTRRSSFSRFPSRPAWSRRGPLTHLAWARCSRGIRHAQSGLVGVLSHALRGLVVLAVSVTPGVVSSRSSHTPCVGSLFVWGLVVAAPVSRIERGRSVERDNRLRGEESPD